MTHLLILENLLFCNTKVDLFAKENEIGIFELGQLFDRMFSRQEYLTIKFVHTSSQAFL